MTLVHDVLGSDSAPVLVLAPSLGTSRQVWDAQTTALAEHFRVVRFEHRGHAGDAPPGPYRLGELAEDVLELADSLGVERFSFCGLSLGGMVGMWLAARVPERVERLAVCCTSAFLPPASGWLDRAVTVRAGGMSAVADAVVERWFTPDFAAAAPEVVARARGMLLETPTEGYAGCCEAIAAMDLRPELPAIAAPTLVLAGARDLATPVGHARLIATGVAGARLAVVSDAAHLAPMEQPDQCTRLLVAHLRDHS